MRKLWSTFQSWQTICERKKHTKKSFISRHKKKFRRCFHNIFLALFSLSLFIQREMSRMKKNKCLREVWRFFPHDDDLEKWKFNFWLKWDPFIDDWWLPKKSKNFYFSCLNLTIKIDRVLWRIREKNGRENSRKTIAKKAKNISQTLLFYHHHIENLRPVMWNSCRCRRKKILKFYCAKNFLKFVCKKNNTKNCVKERRAKLRDVDSWSFHLFFTLF